MLMSASDPNGGLSNLAQLKSSDAGCVIRIFKNGTVPHGNVARAW